MSNNYEIIIIIIFCYVNLYIFSFSSKELKNLLLVKGCLEYQSILANFKLVMESM